MKYSMMFLSILGSALLIPSATVATECLQTFIGEIGSEYAIRVTIEHIGDEVWGTFVSYLDNPVPIQGTVDSEQQITLPIRDQLHPLCGTLVGKFVTQDHIEGTWIAYDEKTSAPFFLERATFLEFESQTSEGKAIHVFRVPGEDGDTMKVEIEGEQPLFFPEGCYGYSALSSDVGIDPSSIHVTHLAGMEPLMLLEWATYPQGNGRYEAFYYMLFPPGHTDTVLLKNYVGNGQAGMNNWGKGNYSINYHDNLVTILEHYDYLYDGVPGELQISRTYRVETYELRLVKAEEWKREQTNPEQELTTYEWIKRELSLEEAMQEYPLIQDGYP